MTRSRHPIRLLSAWVLANLIGGFVVGFLENNGFQFMATLIWSGAIVGSFQWLVLRGQGQFGWWPMASATGWIVSTLVTSRADGFYRPLVEGLWSWLGGWEVLWLNVITEPMNILGMAIAQSLMLKPRGRSTGIWILASLVGAGVQGGVSATLCANFCAVLPTTLVGIVHGLGWAAYGVVTGVAAIYVLKPQPDTVT
ncbi:MAG: hypothetical protein AAFW95_10515 [Cyanobacteria bacterium J06638_6]